MRPQAPDKSEETNVKQERRDVSATSLQLSQSRRLAWLTRHPTLSPGELQRLQDAGVKPEVSEVTDAWDAPSDQDTTVLRMRAIRAWDGQGVNPGTGIEGPAGYTSPSWWAAFNLAAARARHAGSDESDESDAGEVLVVTDADRVTPVVGGKKAPLTHAVRQALYRARKLKEGIR